MDSTRRPRPAPLRLVLPLAACALAACGPEEDAGGRPFACGPAPLVFDAYGDVAHAEGDAGCARIERRAVPLEENFICKACPYDPLRLVVHAAGLDLDVPGDPEGAALTYTATHHNWADVVEARASDGALLAHARLLYDGAEGAWSIELRSAEQDDDGDGDNDAAPVAVLPVRGLN